MSEDTTIIWGARNIAKHVGLPVRATYHALEAGHLPGVKIGDRWALRPAALAAKFEAAEAETAKPKTEGEAA